MRRLTRGVALLCLVGCGSVETSGPLKGMDSIAFLQRQPRISMSNVLEYSSYAAGARLVKLSPPTADGQLTVLCCEEQGEDYANVDINSFDVSFDAREIVFSARLSADQSYGLFLMTLEDRNVEQLPTDPNRHYVHPVFLAGDQIMFMTGAVTEEGALQYRDESDRAATVQIGVIHRDGTGERLGGRNLSHRLTPTALSDGRVLFSQWDHLGQMNEAHLMIANADMTSVQEAFGKEGQAATQFYVKPVEIAPGRVVAIGTSRHRTLQAGALVDIRLGETYIEDEALKADLDMSEANSSYQILSGQVPLGRDPSASTIGRYYSAHPLNRKERPDFLVSWADGPVHGPTQEAANLPADFGIFLFESEAGIRKPIWNNPKFWDVHPKPLVPREAPPLIQPSGKNEYSDEAVLIGSIDVYDSSLGELDANTAAGVRVIEGFGTEEGFPGRFGSSLHDGAAQLGVVRVQDDGSWAALVPASVAVQLQVVDRFGMSLSTEPVWISGNAGESRFCAGCHENRLDISTVHPGVTEAAAVGPADLMSGAARSARMSMDFSRDAVVGVPWDLALQPIFDTYCISCHNGAGGAANPSWSITEVGGSSFSWTFDLRGRIVNSGLGAAVFGGYSASYISLVGPDPQLLENPDLVISGNIPDYVVPQNGRGSRLLQVLNPMQMFPDIDAGVRAFGTTPHGVTHGFELTPEELYLMVVMVEMGGQFYSRENRPSP